MNYPKKVTVCEVSTRDGFQTLPPPNTAEKLTILELCAAAGIPEIEVGTFRAKADGDRQDFKNTPEVFRKMRRAPGVTYRALIQTAEDMRLALDSGCTKVKVNISGTEKHYRISSGGSTLEEGMKGFREIGALAAQHNVTMLGSISLAFVSPYDDGMVDGVQLKKIIRTFIDCGATEISLNDTAGMSAPNQIYQRFIEMKESFPEVKVWALHAHNTRGNGLASVLAALMAGVDRIDSSLAGIGGCPVFKSASGNISTEDLLYMLHGMDIETGIDFQKAIIAGQYVGALVPEGKKDSYIQRLEVIKRAGGGVVE